MFMQHFFYYQKNYDIFLSSKIHNPIGLYDARANPELASWALLLFCFSVVNKNLHLKNMVMLKSKTLFITMF